jgi:hypothetical protein
MRRGVMNQPHSLQARRVARDALGLDNGGGSGSGYSAHDEPFTLQLRGPFVSDVRTGFHLTPLSVTSYRCVLVLFKAFSVYSIDAPVYGIFPVSSIPKIIESFIHSCCW